MVICNFLALTPGVCIKITKVIFIEFESGAEFLDEEVFVGREIPSIDIEIESILKVHSHLVGNSEFFTIFTESRFV